MNHRLLYVALLITALIVSVFFGARLYIDIGCGQSAFLGAHLRNRIEENNDLADVRGSLLSKFANPAVRGLIAIRVSGHRLFVEDPSFNGSFITYNRMRFLKDGGPNGRPAVLSGLWAKIFERNHPHDIFRSLHSVYVLGPSGTVVLVMPASECVGI